MEAVAAEKPIVQAKAAGAKTPPGETRAALFQRLCAGPALN